MPPSDPSFVYVNLATASADALGAYITVSYVFFALLLIIGGALLYRLFNQ